MQTGYAGHRPPATLLEPWRVLEGGYGWEDLVLPAHEVALLKTVPDELRERQSAVSEWAAAHALDDRGGAPKPGLRLYFGGDEGTGKTLAARILGDELGRPVFHVDLGSLLPEDRRLAEELIARLFTAAESARAILLFAWSNDGPGALVRLPDAQERRIAIVVSGLLEYVDRYPGVVIFAGPPNMRVDEAPIERFDIEIGFPFPGRAARLPIWRNELAGAQVSPTDLDDLATSFQLSGAAIHACCVAAARDAKRAGAPVDMPRVALAVERAHRGLPVNAPTRAALQRMRTVAAAQPQRSERAGATAARGPARAGGESIRLSGSRRQSVARAGRRSLLLAGAGAIAAAAIGFVAAHSSGGGTTNATSIRHASSGLLDVSFTSGWRRTSTSSPQLGLLNALTLEQTAPVGGRLVLGTAHTTAASFLPQGLLAALPAPPSAQVVTLGANTFYRYPDLTPRGLGASESVYALPVTNGTILGACVTRTPTVAFTSRCEALLATVRLPAGAGHALVPSPTYAAGLSRAIAKLNATRTDAGHSLRAARSARAQARAAGELALAHTQAAAALRRLPVGPPTSAANGAVATALQMTGAAYHALARAATAGNLRAYGTAVTQFNHATSALNAAYAELRGLGYKVG